MTDRMNGADGGPALMDVDRLLRDFYRSEMPDPWPAVRLPSRRPARIDHLQEAVPIAGRGEAVDEAHQFVGVVVTDEPIELVAVPADLRNVPRLMIRPE